MEQLLGGYTLTVGEDCFPLSTDSMVLADFIPGQKYKRVLDLGSGCGTLGLLLYAQGFQGQLVGLELTPSGHEAALENIRQNSLEGRMDSICADLRQSTTLLTPGFFDCCVSNPPYFSSGEASQRFSQARQTLSCQAGDLFAAAAHALSWGGDFYLVHKPENLALLCQLGGEYGLEPKRIRPVRHQASKSPSLILLQCRKGGKTGLVWEDLTLRDAQGLPTADYRRIYHTEGA